MSRSGPTLAGDAVAPVFLFGLAPLAFLPDALVPTFAPKWFLIVVSVPAGLAVVAARRPLHWPARTAWLAWLAVLAAATAVGVAPVMSITGSPHRNFGMLAWVLCAAAFVLGSGVGDSPVVVRATLRAAIGGAAAVSVFALIEIVDLDVVGLGDLATTSRARSTWGSATFLGGYLVVVLPIAVSHLRAADRWVRVAATCTAGSGLTAIALSQSRGAWLGLGVAAVVMAWPHLRAQRLVVAGAIVGLVAVAALAVGGPVLDRASATGRLDLWSVSIRASLDRPALGSGPDTQRIVLPAAISDAFEREHGSEELHDRAHHLFLDTVITTGLIGLAAFLLLILTVGRSVSRAAGSGAVARSIAAGLAGYLAHLVVAFSEATLDPLVWMLAGLTIGMGRTAETEPTPATTPTSPDRPGNPWRRAGVALGIAVAALGGIWSGAELIAEVRAGRLLSGANTDARSPAEVARALGEIAAAAPARFDLDQATARIWISAGRTGAERAIERLDDALTTAPGDPELLLDRATALAAAGRLDEADRAFSEILARRYPSSWRAHLGLGSLAADRGDPRTAEREWRRAASLGPTQALPWRQLAALLAEEGRAKESQAALEQAERLESGGERPSTGISVPSSGG